MTLSMTMLCIMLSVVVIIVAFFYCYAECHYSECRYAECRGAIRLNLTLLHPQPPHTKTYFDKIFDI